MGKSKKLWLGVFCVVAAVVLVFGGTMLIRSVWDKKAAAEQAEQSTLPESTSEQPVVPETEYELGGSGPNYKVYRTYTSDRTWSLDYVVYDNQGKEIFTGPTHYAQFNYISDSLLETLFSGGTGLRVTRYFDVEKGLVSPDYGNARVGCGKVAYAEYNEELKRFDLIVRDIFDEAVFYQEYQRPFATGTAYAPLEAAVFFDENHLFIEYATEDNVKWRRLTTELIDLRDQTALINLEKPDEPAWQKNLPDNLDRVTVSDYYMFFSTTDKPRIHQYKIFDVNGREIGSGDTGENWTICKYVNNSVLEITTRENPICHYFDIKTGKVWTEVHENP